MKCTLKMTEYTGEIANTYANLMKVPYFSSASEDFPSQLMNEPLIILRDQIQNRSPRKENTDKITPQENANIGEPRRSARERRKFTPYVHIP